MTALELISKLIEVEDRWVEDQRIAERRENSTEFLEAVEVIPLSKDFGEYLAGLVNQHETLDSFTQLWEDKTGGQMYYQISGEELGFAYLLDHDERAVANICWSQYSLSRIEKSVELITNFINELVELAGPKDL